MEPLVSWSGTRQRTAPSYGVPPRTLVSIEHPCVVKDVDKGLASLTAGRQIPKLLASSQRDTPAKLTLHPEDPMSKELTSSSKRANNVLLKITVPKRTGRKRKRGSQEPYRYHGASANSGNGDVTATSSEADDARGLNARQLLRRLQDNADKYQVEAVGLVERHHVFRGMPDFVYSTTASPFVNKFREKILPFEFTKMKEFKLDMRKGCLTNADILPPPSLSTSDIPFNYFYRQNPGVKQLVDPTGQITTINTQQANKILTHIIPFDTPNIPSAPKPECPPVSSLDKALQETIQVLETRFSQRAGWTRRALRNSLETREQKVQLRMAIPYVGYNFRSGPFRDAIIRLGHDPRTDPESRIYQTVTFRLGAETGAVGEDQPPPAPAAQQLGSQATNRRAAAIPRPQIGANSDNTKEEESAMTSHIFNGKPPIYYDAKTWMMVDITDPQLAPFIAVQTPQPTCDSVFGWYGNVALASIRAIMRAKITHMLAYNTEYSNPEDLTPLLYTLPRHVETEDEVGRLSVTDNQKCVPLAAEIRSTIRTGMNRQRDEQEELERGGAGEEQERKRVQWEDEGEEGEEEVEEGEGEAEAEEEELDEVQEALEEQEQEYGEEDEQDDEMDVDSEKD